VIANQRQNQLIDFGTPTRVPMLNFAFQPALSCQAIRDQPKVAMQGIHVRSGSNVVQLFANSLQ
jgi:hypothetical protein